MLGKKYYHKSNLNFILVCISDIPLDKLNPQDKIICRWIDSSGKLNEQLFQLCELTEYTPPRPRSRSAKVI